MVLAAIINVLWYIWFSRNKSRFENKTILVTGLITMICAAVALSGSISHGTMSNSIDEFSILRKFSVVGHPQKALMVKQINWFPPPCGRIKCNTDGAAKGFPGLAGCGGIFRDSSAAVLGCYAYSLGISSALFEELFGIILAVEMTMVKGWNKLWIECDSMIAIKCSLEAKKQMEELLVVD